MYAFSHVSLSDTFVPAVRFKLIICRHIVYQLQLVHGDQINEDEMGRTYGTNGEMKNAYTNLVGKSEKKRPLQTPRRIWENNIEVDVKEIVCAGVYWVQNKIQSPAPVKMILSRF
jgi:hypothetical protein